MSANAVAAKALSSRAVNVNNVRVRARANPRATSAVVRRAIMSEEIRVSGENAEQYAEFANLLDQYQYNYKIGDVISGTVKACDAKGAWVEIGAKSEALCPTAEASLGNVRNVRARLTRIAHFFLLSVLHRASSWAYVATSSTRRREPRRMASARLDVTRDDAVRGGGLLILKYTVYPYGKYTGRPKT